MLGKKIIVFFIVGLVVPQTSATLSEPARTTFEQRLNESSEGCRIPPATLRQSRRFGLPIESTLFERKGQQQSISDNQAYRMVFRFLSGQAENPQNEARLISYVRNVLGVTDRNDVRQIIHIASKFEKRVKSKDLELMQIKNRSHGEGHSNYSQIDLQRMALLEGQRDQVVDDLVREMPPRLENILRAKMIQRVKPKIRVY